MNFNLMNKTSESGLLPDGFLTVLEQLPGHFAVQDQTQVLRTRDFLQNPIFKEYSKKKVHSLQEIFGDTPKAF